jgi:hypothetical protein
MIICGCAAREVIILILCLIGVSAKKTSAISSLSQERNDEFNEIDIDNHRFN